MNEPKKSAWPKPVPVERIRELLDERSLRIARIYKRFVAFAVDVGLIGFVVYYIMVIKKIGYSGFGATSARELWPVMAILFCLLMSVYNLICIPVFNGTIGTWIVGVRLMSTNGQRINCVQAIMRGLFLGIVTLYIFPFIITLHTVWILIRWKRNAVCRTLWDLASQKVVVEKN